VRRQPLRIRRPVRPSNDALGAGIWQHRRPLSLQCTVHRPVRDMAPSRTQIQDNCHADCAGTRSESRHDNRRVWSRCRTRRTSVRTVENWGVNVTVYTYIPRSKLVASNAGKPTVGEEVGRDQPSPTVLRGEAARLSALSSCRAVDSREYTVAGNRRRVWHCTDRVVVWVWSCGRNGYGAAASRFTLGRWYRIPTWVGPWTTSVGCVVRRVSVVRSLGGSTTPARTPISPGAICGALRGVPLQESSESVQPKAEPSIVDRRSHADLHSGLLLIWAASEPSSSSLNGHLKAASGFGPAGLGQVAVPARALTFRRRRLPLRPLVLPGTVCCCVGEWRRRGVAGLSDRGAESGAGSAENARCHGGCFRVRGW